MVTKAVFILFLQALLTKSVLCQCSGPGVLRAPYAARLCDGGAPIEHFGCGSRIGNGGYYGLGPSGNEKNPPFGGGFMVTSLSPMTPTGLRVRSENTIEGKLAVIGNLPFLGVVVTDGAFKSIGTGAVSYNCGESSVGITAENVTIPPVKAPPFIPGPGFPVPPTSGLLYGRGFPFSYRGRCGVN